MRERCTAAAPAAAPEPDPERPLAGLGAQQVQSARQLGGAITSLPAGLMAAGVTSAAEPDAQQTSSDPAALQVRRPGPAAALQRTALPPRRSASASAPNPAQSCASPPQVLHDQVALAASKAGGIHHLGEPVARAANIAELACDPAAAVDFDCAQVGGACWQVAGAVQGRC